MFHGPVDPWVKKGIELLRSRIHEENIPSSQLDESLNVATWNIREFGRKRRSDAAIHYIAEIAYQFDIIAVTELRDDLSDLARVLRVLGPYWKVVFNDYAMDRGGNSERMALVYDERAVRFTGLAAECTPPRKKNHETGEYEAEYGWWRPPFMASFRAGNFDFVIVLAHIRWGDGAAARVTPLRLLAEWIDRRRKDDNNYDDDIVVMGDFNIVSREDETYRAITSKGLTAPPGILQSDAGSNLSRTKHYDQILHYPRTDDVFSQHGGTLDFARGNLEALFDTEEFEGQNLTYQLSDHLPLWVQLNVDAERVSFDQKLDFVRW